MPYWPSLWTNIWSEIIWIYYGSPKDNWYGHRVKRHHPLTAVLLREFGKNGYNSRLRRNSYYQFWKSLWINQELHFIVMSPPFRVGRHIVFPRASVCLSVRLSVRLSVCLSVTNRVRSITWKPLKLYSWNFIQILISMRWIAECKNGNSAFDTFGVISPWTLCITKIVSAL